MYFRDAGADLPMRALDCTESFPSQQRHQENYTHIQRQEGFLMSQRLDQYSKHQQKDNFTIGGQKQDIYSSSIKQGNTYFTKSVSI